MNNTNFENYDPRTYYDYLKLGDVNTKPFLMIAELIDNSISSFEKKYGDTWGEKLIININMNFIGNSIDINEYKVLKNSYISFVDNGFGMNSEELMSAVKLNTRSSSTSKMNVHGRGLKQCAFFFGVDLSIKTSTENEGDWFISQKLSDQSSDNEPYFIKTSKGEKSQRGTEILIENIRENKLISYNSWKRIKETLEFRYIKYLQKNAFEIHYNFNGQDIGKFYEPTEPTAFVHQAFESNNYSNSVFNEFLEKNEEFAKKDLSHRSSEVFSGTVNNAIKEIKKLFIETKKDNTTKFKFNLNLELDGKAIPFEFWMLPKKHGKYRGIRLFEGQRAINHAGYQELETKPYMDWKNNKMETGSTENVFAGQCDLSLLGLKSKTDKSSFTISDTLRHELDKRIFSVWVAFNAFAITSRKEMKNLKGQTPTAKERRVLESIISTKFTGSDIKLINSNEKNEVTKLEYSSKNNVLWDIKISVDNKVRPKQIFDKTIDEENTTLSLKVFTAHLFWNDMTKLKNDFYTEAVLPVTILIAIQYIELLEGENCDPIDILNISGEQFIK